MKRTAEGSTVAARADGWSLHLSARSATGYTGVCYNPKAYARKPYHARGPPPQLRHLGSFATAVEGAVAYAKHVANEESDDEDD